MFIIFMMPNIPFLSNKNQFLKKESKSRQREVSVMIYFKTYVLNKVSQDDCFVKGKALHPQGCFYLDPGHVYA